MIKGGSIDYIDCLSIEFHAHKFRGENRDLFTEKHKELKEYFKDCKSIKYLQMEHMDLECKNNFIQETQNAK